MILLSTHETVSEEEEEEEENRPNDITYLIPNNDRPWLPRNAACEVQRANMLVQELQQNARLLRLQPHNLSSNGRVDEKGRLTRDGMRDDKRVDGFDGFCKGTFGANSRDFSHRRASMQELEIADDGAECRGESFIRRGERGKRCVTAPTLRHLENPEERDAGSVGSECLVDMPEVIGCARAEKRPEISSMQKSVEMNGPCMNAWMTEYLRFLVGIDDLEFWTGSFWITHCWMLAVSSSSSANLHIRTSSSELVPDAAAQSDAQELSVFGYRCPQNPAPAKPCQSNII